MLHHVPRGLIGHHLVRRGVLTPRQVRAVLCEQQTCALPFGAIAETRFGVDPDAVVAAWAEQYAGLQTACDLDQEPTGPAARSLLTRRQAWQRSLLPLRIEPGAVVCATSIAALPRAATFAWRRLAMPVDLRLAAAALPPRPALSLAGHA
jgi:hypothetical protein